MTRLDWENRALHRVSRRTAALASACFLVALTAGCGGGGDDSAASTTGGSSNAPPAAPPAPPPPSTFSVGGTVSGLAGSLTLKNNGADDLAIAADGTFTFATKLDANANYSVSITGQPASQNCTIANGTGTVSNANVSNVSVTCAPQADVAISGMNPSHGTVFTHVKLTGSGFSTVLTDNVVKLNNMDVNVIDATATELTVEVPRRAGSGNFEVSVQSKSAESPLFTYDLTSVTVSTLAGKDLGFRDDQGEAAQFRSPSGVVLNNAGGLFVADSGNHKIRGVTHDAIVSTIAGNTEGSDDGQGVLALFSGPFGLAFDSSNGNLFVSDPGNNNIRKVTASGLVTTFVRSGLSGPAQLAFDGGNNLYVVDKGTHRILKLNETGGTDVFAGAGTPGDVDGPARDAKFQFPSGLAFCGDDAFVADENNMKIRKISAGIVSTYTGSNGGLSYVDGTLAEAKFLFPFTLACDQFQKLFVVDSGNNKIRMITPSGIVSTLAGSTVGFADGDGATARFSLPQFIAIDADGTIFVGDAANSRIRKIEWE